MQACCGRQNVCPLSPFMHTPGPLSWSAVSSFIKNGPFSEGQLVHGAPCLRSLRMAHAVRGSPLRADLRLVDSLTALCQTTHGKDVPTCGWWTVLQHFVRRHMARTCRPAAGGQSYSTLSDDSQQGRAIRAID